MTLTDSIGQLWDGGMQRMLLFRTLMTKCAYAWTLTCYMTLGSNNVQVHYVAMRHITSGINFL